MINPLHLDLRLPLRAATGRLFISRGQGRHVERVIDSHELIFGRRSWLEMQEEGRPFTVEAGQALHLWPGRRHGGTEPYPPDLSFYWLHFHMPEHCLVSRAEQSRHAFAVPQLTAVRRPELLEELFRRFLDDQESGRLLPVTADLLLLLMLFEVADRRPSAPGAEGAAAALASRAEAHIQMHFDRTITTATIARELRCNPDYLKLVRHEKSE